MTLDHHAVKKGMRGKKLTVGNDNVFAIYYPNRALVAQTAFVRWVADVKFFVPNDG